MPSIDKIVTITITPEQFLNACSPIELHELGILLHSPRFSEKRFELFGSAEEPSAEFKEVHESFGKELGS